jgi:hypothetical protein
MKSEALAAILARVHTKVDLRKITHEQAMYAILDRALLVAEREQSWWRNIRMGLIYIGVPTIIVAFALWWYGLWWWLALGIGAVLLNAAWLRDLTLLAAEGRNARIATILAAAVQPLSDPPPPDDATEPERQQTGGGGAHAQVPLKYFGE